MRNLSVKAQKIVRELYELTRFRLKHGRQERENATHQLLRELATLGEPAAITYIAPFVAGSTDDIRQAARNAISLLSIKLMPYDLIHLSDYFVWSRQWYFADAWEGLSPSQVLFIASDQDGQVSSPVLGLLSFHRNGFVRQEAVRQLSKCEDGSELPFLLIRLNDWVQPIADDAKRAVGVRINDSYVRHLAANLPLIVHLAKLSRRDHADIVTQVTDLILEERHDDILREVIRGSEREARREVTRYGLAKVGEHRSRLVRYGIASDDPIDRLLCCYHIVDAVEPARLKSVLDYLAADTFRPVRQESLRIKSEQFPEQALQLWQAALLDRSRSIRELARFSLSKLGFHDVTSIYRATIAEQPDHLPALEGLAETGDKSDVEAFRQLLHHPLPSRRVVAIRGLIRVEGETAVTELLPLLMDESPTVVREVRNAIDPHLRQAAGDELLSVALHARSSVARKYAVELLAELGKWRGIPWLLKVASIAEDGTARYAEDAIEQWFTPPKCNKVYIRPTEAEKRDVETALATSEWRQGDRILKLIKDGLAQFK